MFTSLHVPHFTCHMSHVPCHMSNVAFLSAPSSSRSLVVGPSVRWSVRQSVRQSVGHLCEKVTFRLSNGNLNLPTYSSDSCDIYDSCDTCDSSDSSDSSNSRTVVTVMTVVTVVREKKFVKKKLFLVMRQNSKTQIVTKPKN